MRRTGPTQATRDAVYVRDHGRCVLCSSAVGLQIHHRRPRGAGGTRRPETNGLANLLLVCEDPCHIRIESNRTWALATGLLVPQHADPSAVPVDIEGNRRWLHDDGTITEAA